MDIANQLNYYIQSHRHLFYGHMDCCDFSYDSYEKWIVAINLKLTRVYIMEHCPDYYDMIHDPNVDFDDLMDVADPLGEILYDLFPIIGQISSGGDTIPIYDMITIITEWLLK